MKTIDYIPERGQLEDWGDNRANRSDRFLAAGGLCRVPWFTIIGGGISDDISLAINSAVGSFHDDFGTSVPIEVINHELGVVCTCTDIASHINAPESFAG